MRGRTTDVVAPFLPGTLWRQSSNSPFTRCGEKHNTRPRSRFNVPITATLKSQISTVLSF